jgi:hypothetical protein
MRPLRSTRLTLILGALCGGLSGCSADQVHYEGRPCSSTEPCGGGTTCDPARGVCVAADASAFASDTHGSGGSKEAQPPSETALPPDYLVDLPPASDGPKLTPDRALFDRNKTIDTGKSVDHVKSVDHIERDHAKTLDHRAPDHAHPADNGCTKSCSGKLCGASDGCGGTCATGSGCCTPSCSGKVCGASDGCGSTCDGGSGCTCPTCYDLGMYPGSDMVGCAFSGSSCTCSGSDTNGNNTCDSGESCYGNNNCVSGTSTLCSTKHNPKVPSGCTAISYCFQC